MQPVNQKQVSLHWQYSENALSTFSPNSFSPLRKDLNGEKGFGEFPDENTIRIPGAGVNLHELLYSYFVTKIFLSEIIDSLSLPHRSGTSA